MVPSKQTALTAYARILHHAKLSGSSSGSVGIDSVFKCFDLTQVGDATDNPINERYSTSHHRGEHKYKGQHREHKHLGRRKKISLRRHASCFILSDETPVEPRGVNMAS